MEGDFDTFDNYVLPRVGDFDILLRKSPLYIQYPPPPLGLDIDRYIIMHKTKNANNTDI